MSLFAKIMVVVNFILAVAFLSAAGTLLGAAEDYKGKFEDTQKKMEKETAALTSQVTAEQNKTKDATARQAEADKARAAAEASLKTLSSTNDQLAVALQALKGDYEKLAAAQVDLQSKNSEKDKTIDSLRGEVSASEAARREADGKLMAANDAIARLTQEKETAEKNLDTANAQNTSLNKQVEDDKVLLARYRNEKGPLTGGVAMTSVKGVVNAVNNSVDIFVISVGAKDGVKAGYEFTVYRGSEYVSTIVIDKVFPNYSSGTTKPGTKKKDVQAGDECATIL